MTSTTLQNFICSHCQTYSENGLHPMDRNMLYSSTFTAMPIGYLTAYSIHVSPCKSQTEFSPELCNTFNKGRGQTKDTEMQNLKMNSDGLSLQFLFVTSPIILQWWDIQVYTFHPSCNRRPPRNQNSSRVCVDSSSNLLCFSAWKRNDQILLFIRPVEKKVPSQENKNDFLIT